jgi:3',5'-cyclic AMP phosphodiesterase CpdA
LLYARAGKVDRIFCGHTHVATHQSRHGVDYYNSGCWVNADPTYLSVDEEGVRVRQYEGIKYAYEAAAESTAKSEAELVPVGDLGDLFAPANLSALASYESLRC